MASTYYVMPTSDASSGCAYPCSSIIRLLGANQTCFSCLVKKAYSFSTSQTSPSHSCHLWHYFILLHSWGEISFCRYLCTLPIFYALMWFPSTFYHENFQADRKAGRILHDFSNNILLCLLCYSTTKRPIHLFKKCISK